MRKSVLLRHILLLLLSTVLLSGLITAGFYILVTKNMYVQMRADELKPIAHTVANMMTDAIQKEESVREIWPLLRNNNKDFLGALLHVYNARGQSLISRPLNPNRETPDFDNDGAGRTPPIEENDLLQLVSGDLATILTGKEVSEIRESKEGESYLLVGVPIQDDGQIMGAVIFTKSVNELSAAMRGLNATLLISTLASFLIMLIPAYFLAKRLVVPIRQMERVAHAMAKGDFSVRANESQKGEIGELARSMNHFALESERLEQTRRDYVANVSHELRTPIAAIRAMGETLRDKMAKSEEKQAVFYGNIVSESLRLSRLVDDLLELSRLQSGTVAMQKSTFDIREVIQDIGDVYRYVIEDAGFVFQFSVDMEKTIRVYSNQDRIEQVLVILLDNAMKYTPERGTVGLSMKDCADYVEIGVFNTGEGIPKEDIPYIFERFYKADKSHSGGGTGLGLSIAKEIMQGLGESITVENDGDHTSFILTVHKP